MGSSWRVIDIYRDLGYAWVWRFLMTWRDGEFWIGYYPDYETPTWSYSIRV